MLVDPFLREGRAVGEVLIHVGFNEVCDRTTNHPEIYVEFTLHNSFNPAVGCGVEVQRAMAINAAWHERGRAGPLTVIGAAGVFDVFFERCATAAKNAAERPWNICCGRKERPRLLNFGIHFFVRINCASRANGLEHLRVELAVEELGFIVGKRNTAQRLGETNIFSGHVTL